jgi:SAM-dependent methyltransferase
MCHRFTRRDEARTAETAQATHTTGSAERWGPLWGARPADWALNEDRQTPTYEAALARVGLAVGEAVLDIGCGVGTFLRLVTERGTHAFGLDASPALIDFARQRLPEADLRVEMETLPYQDDTFDLVTGFNSFFFANDTVAAVREAGLVAKPGAPVVIQVWGRHESNDLEAMKQIVSRTTGATKWRLRVPTRAHTEARVSDRSRIKLRTGHGVR